MHDLEARVIEYLLADNAVKIITTDISSEKLPIVVVDKKITVKVDYELTHPVFDSDTATITVKVWINTRSPLVSEPVKALKDLAFKVVTALDRTGDLLTKLTGGWTLTAYSVRKLGRTDDLNSNEQLWFSIIVFEVIKNV
jgi:hypothetical protein